MPSTPSLFTSEELTQIAETFCLSSYKRVKKEELDKIVRDFEASLTLTTILQTYIEVKKSEHTDSTTIY